MTKIAAQKQNTPNSSDQNAAESLFWIALNQSRLKKLKRTLMATWS
jgi:hypothetical protein